MTSTPSTSGGGKGGSGPSGGSKGSSKGSKGGGKGKGKGGDGAAILALANHVPAHHAHHGMGGHYATKGRFANMPDGSQAFED